MSKGAQHCASYWEILSSQHSFRRTRAAYPNAKWAEKWAHWYRYSILLSDWELHQEMITPARFLPLHSPLRCLFFFEHMILVNWNPRKRVLDPAKPLLYTLYRPVPTQKINMIQYVCTELQIGHRIGSITPYSLWDHWTKGFAPLIRKDGCDGSRRSYEGFPHIHQLRQYLQAIHICMSVAVPVSCVSYTARLPRGMPVMIWADRAAGPNRRGEPLPVPVLHKSYYCIAPWVS